MRTPEEPLRFDGPAGVLEGILHAVERPRGIAVVCHPHPLHEGTMRNKVVHTVARAFADGGIAGLRFNFRGVGASAGAYDRGAGETDDALAAVGVLRARYGPLPLWLAGFSFGSFVALNAARRGPCAGLILIAPAVKRFQYGADALPECPCLVIQGDADEVADPAAVVEWLNGADPAPEFVSLPGVGHFFHGQLNRLRDLVAEFIADA